MSLRDLLILSGLWAVAGAVFLLLIELRLRHHLGRLGSVGESLDAVALALRTRVEGMDAKLVETRQEQMRQAEAIGGLRESVDMLMDSHKGRHGIVSGGGHG